MIGKLIGLVASILIGASALGVVLGLIISVFVIAVLSVRLLWRGGWVPVSYNLRSLAARKWTTVLTAAGLTLVVFVFTSVLMLTNGIYMTLAATGSPGNAKLIRRGAQSEIQSTLGPEHLRLVASAPEVALGSDGQPLISPELAVLIFADKTDSAQPRDGSNLTVRGIGAKGFVLHPARSITGRRFQSGTSEVVVGKAIYGRFRGMRLGEQIRFGRRLWTVVGSMDHGGTAFDSEIWGDVGQIMDAFQRQPEFSSLTVQVKSSAEIAALRQRAGATPMLNTIDVLSEVDYWAAQSEQLARFVKFFGSFVTVLFACGAILGAMITMYAQVSARTREIGTLRAFGFRRRAVLISFTVESVLLALLAGALGVGAASLLRFVSFSTLNVQSYSEITFHFYLVPWIIAAALGFAAAIGYAGGLLPALSAARMPIGQAVRDGLAK